MSEAILVQQASKTFGRHPLPAWKRATDPLSLRERADSVVALDQVTFSVAEGEIFGIVGPHGSGKSTLLRLVSAQLRPDAGSVEVFGRDAARQPEQVQRLSGQVAATAGPATAGFWQRLSALEYLTYAARLYGLDSQQARQQMIGLLRFLGLEEEEIDRPAAALSSVAQFKIDLARLLLFQPRLLLLDDPLSGRPESDKQAVLEALRAVNRELGVTLLFFSRDQAAAQEFCLRLARLEQGRLALETD